jgi:Protein of unknown function (DUF3572)
MTIRQPKPQLPQAELLAIAGLHYLADDGERLGRFLTLTGIGPADLRAAAGEPHLLAAVLEYLLGDEPLLLAFCANGGQSADDVQHAWDLLVREDARRRHA